MLSACNSPQLPDCLHRALTPPAGQEVGTTCFSSLPSRLVRALPPEASGFLDGEPELNGTEIVQGESEATLIK